MSDTTLVEPVLEEFTGLCIPQDEITDAEARLKEITGEIQLTPTMSNEVILDKLTHLVPLFERVRDQILSLRVELSNGIVRWDEIIERNCRCR